MKRIYDLYISHIDWDVDPGETPSLPTSISHYKITNESDELLDEEVVEALTEEYGWCINSVDFVIDTISIELTDTQKERYINTYSEDDFIKIFNEMKNREWKFVYHPDTPEGNYDVELTVDGVNQDMMTREYAENILRETI